MEKQLFVIVSDGKFLSWFGKWVPIRLAARKFDNQEEAEIEAKMMGGKVEEFAP